MFKPLYICTYTYASFSKTQGMLGEASEAGNYYADI